MSPLSEEARAAIVKLAPLLAYGFILQPRGKCLLVSHKHSSAYVASDSINQAEDPVTYTRDAFEGIAWNQGVVPRIH